MATNDSIAQLEREVGEKAERTALYREQLSRLRAVNHSPDHTVTVTTAPGGVAIGLSLTEGAMALGPDELARVILATMRSGTAEIARRTIELTRELVGEGNPALMEMMERHLPDLDGEASLALAPAVGPRAAGWTSLQEPEL